MEIDDDKMKDTRDEMIRRLKELKFNPPDFENLRRRAPEAQEKAKKFEEETKRSQRISDRFFLLRFDF